MSAVQEFHDRKIARLERSGWTINAALRQRLEVVELRPPAEVAVEHLDEGAGDGDGASACWMRVEHVAVRLRKHFVLFRFSNGVDYGLLAIPTSNRPDTRGTMDLNIRCGQQPDLAEDFVDPALREGIDLAGSAGTGGTTLAKDDWTVVADVVGQYGISARSHEGVTAATGLFEVDGTDTRTPMVRRIWGVRLLQCPPGFVPDSDYTERWTFTLLPAEGLVGGRAVSDTVLKKRVRFRLSKADRGIGSARMSPALPLM